MKTQLVFIGLAAFLLFPLESYCQGTDMSTMNYQFNYSIPAWNANGSIIISGGMIDEPGGKTYGYFRITDGKGKMLANITPVFLDKLLAKTSTMRDSRALSGPGARTKRITTSIDKEILELRNILADRTKMMDLLRRMNLAKDNNSLSVVEWNKIVTTVRNAQVYVTGTFE